MGDTCACPSDDARGCHVERYAHHHPLDDEDDSDCDDVCECCCHEPDDFDE